MSKAILIMDMPDSCLDCRFCREIDEGTEACCEIMDEPNDSLLCRMIDSDYCQSRPSWCPLRYVPSKQYHSMYGRNKVETSEDKIWNRCIDKILGT